MLVSQINREAAFFLEHDAWLPVRDCMEQTISFAVKEADLMPITKIVKKL